MLAWGNRAAEKADVELDMLIPASLRKTQDVNDLPGDDAAARNAGR